MATGIPVFNEDGSIREWIGTCIDITEQKNIEKELQDLNEQKNEFFIDALINKVLNFFQHTNENFKIIKRGKLGVKINADEERIEQVLINLISNAIKYSNGKNKAVVKVSKAGKKLIISVKDYVIGISKANQKKYLKNLCVSAGKK